MRTGRVGAGITEAEVEGDERSLVGDSAGKHNGIWSADQLLVGDSVDIVVGGDQWALGGDGDVLVELEPHVVGVSERISCFASHAP